MSKAIQGVAMTAVAGLIILGEDHHLKVNHVLTLYFKERTNHVEVLLGKSGLTSLELQLLYPILNSPNLLHQFGFFCRLVDSAIEPRQRACRSGEARRRSCNSRSFTILF